jgi:hypothetical protein
MPANPELIVAGRGAPGAQKLYMTGTMEIRKRTRDSAFQALD